MGLGDGGFSVGLAPGGEDDAEGDTPGHSVGVLGLGLKVAAPGVSLAASTGAGTIMGIVGAAPSGSAHPSLRHASSSQDAPNPRDRPPRLTAHKTFRTSLFRTMR